MNANHWATHEAMSRLQGYEYQGFYWALNFKPETRYLTEEGYPLGTTCWYVRVELSGINVYCCGDAAEEAIFKGLDKCIELLKEEIKWACSVFCPKQQEEDAKLKQWRSLLEKINAIKAETTPPPPSANQSEPAPSSSSPNPKQSETIATRYKTEIATIEEFADPDLDGWATESGHFETLTDAIVYAQTGMSPEEYSKIHLEVFDPSTKNWETLLNFSVSAAEQIQVISDL